ncbi:hypothetical protein GCM10027614_73880 [Micromonospora vulcania]
MLLASYMIHNHATRADEFGTTGDVVHVNPTVERVVGTPMAEGIAAMIGYPTHGYLGLSYNLQLPFEWSRGLGSSPSAAIFAEQTFDADLSEHPPFPDRTEHEKGWPARQYWATIYPWLASDLTFPGAALFMGFVGWLFAGSWRAAVSSRRVVPTLIFAQLCILIIYVPANNQLGMAPDSIVGMATLLALYGLQSLFGGHRELPRTRDPLPGSPRGERPHAKLAPDVGGSAPVSEEPAERLRVRPVVERLERLAPRGLAHDAPLRGAQPRRRAERLGDLRDRVVPADQALKVGAQVSPHVAGEIGDHRCATGQALAELRREARVRRPLRPADEHREVRSLQGAGDLGLR